MKKKSIYFSMTLISFVLGLMIAFQFRANGYIEQGTTTERVQELSLELSSLEKENQKLDVEIYDLERKLEQAKEGQLQAQSALLDELEKARMGAGLVAATGTGVEVVLNNPASEFGENNVSIIRDEDLLRIVNELRGAGAEAISINGNRLISTSEIRQAGNFIDINLNRTQTPFNILAIGNPEKLKSSLEISGGLVDYFKNLGILINIQTQRKITVPGYNRTLQYDYAKAVRRG